MAAKIYLFPSIHFDSTEADRLSAFITMLVNADMKPVVALEAPNREEWIQFLDNIEKQTADEIETAASSSDFKYTFSRMLAMLSEQKQTNDVKVMPIDVAHVPEIADEVDLRGFEMADPVLAWTLSMLKTDAMREEIRNPEMLKNIKHVLEIYADSPIVAITGAIHTIFLQKALMQEGYAPVLIEEIPEIAWIECEAETIINSQHPDLKRIAERFVALTQYGSFMRCEGTKKDHEDETNGNVPAQKQKS